MEMVTWMRSPFPVQLKTWPSSNVNAAFALMISPRRSGYQCDDAREPCFACDDCFTMHIKIKMEEDLAELERVEGRVYCPSKSKQHNSSAIAVGDIHRYAPHAYLTYESVKYKLFEKKNH